MKITDWLAVIRMNNRQTYVCKISEKGLYAMTNVINYQRVKDVLESENKDLSQLQQWVSNGVELDEMLEENYSGIMIDVKDLRENNESLSLKDAIEINIHGEKIDVNEIKNIYIHSLKQEDYMKMDQNKRNRLMRTVANIRDNLVNYAEPGSIGGVISPYKDANEKDRTFSTVIKGLTQREQTTHRQRWMNEMRANNELQNKDYMYIEEMDTFRGIFDYIALTQNQQMLWQSQLFNKMWKTRNLENLITKSGETK